MAKIPVQPLGRRIVVQVDSQEKEKTDGGLYIPPSAQDEASPEMGTVVAVGTGEEDFEFSVKEGDQVFFEKYKPVKIEIGDVEYLVLSEDDVLAIIN